MIGIYRLGLIFFLWVLLSLFKFEVRSFFLLVTSMDSGFEKLEENFFFFYFSIEKHANMWDLTVRSKSKQNFFSLSSPTYTSL